MYAQDYDETVPPYPLYTAGNFMYAWDQRFDLAANTADVSGGLIQPYMKNAAIVDCPSASGLPVNRNLRIAYGLSYQYVYYPAYQGNGTATLGAYQPATLAAIQMPAETVIMADSAAIPTAGASAGQLSRSRLINPPSYPNVGPSVHGRHSGFANVLWFDGHVKAVRVTLRETHSQGAAMAALHSQHQLGDLLRPGCSFTSACRDYYFQATKTTP
jgi:prepilin-type processing-associated H-X9-DG protein